jgi:CheY-like chemotaxis protein
LRLLEAVLAPRGYDVISATDGDGALELVASAKPDLVLLDVVMPQPDGYTVCRRLRERVETAVLPVIMVTASPGEKTKAIQADGASGLDQNHESRQAGHPPAGLTSGPPGTRTRNLRIKSLVRTCRSERRLALEKRVCVSLVPIVSHRFPFLHGDETGTIPPLALPFRSHVERRHWGPRELLRSGVRRGDLRAPKHRSTSHKLERKRSMIPCRRAGTRGV